MMRGDMAGDAASEAPAGPGLRACLEAILLVVDEPVAEVVLAQVLERPREEIALGIAGLAASYTSEGRGFELREVAGGWRFYTREECAPVVERFVRDGLVDHQQDRFEAGPQARAGRGLAGRVPGHVATHHVQSSSSLAVLRGPVLPPAHVTYRSPSGTSCSNETLPSRYRSSSARNRATTS